MVNGRENFCIQARMGIIITQERDKKMRPNISQNNIIKFCYKKLAMDMIFARNVTSRSSLSTQIGLTNWDQILD